MRNNYPSLLGGGEKLECLDTDLDPAFWLLDVQMNQPPEKAFVPLAPEMWSPGIKKPRPWTARGPAKE